MGRVISGKVTGRGVKVNRDGTKQVRLLQVELTSPEDIQTIELMSQTGEENNPPDGSKVTVIDIGEAWKIAVASDDLIVPSIKPGEKMIYSTDSTGDTIKAKAYLQDDGTILIENGNVTITATPTPAGKLIIITTGNTEITSAKTIINNDVIINGNLRWTGEATGDGGNAPRIEGGLEIENGSVTHNSTNIGDTHVHEQGNDSDGDSEVDTDGPK